ncbi:sigma-54 dependent transcriptional regulator [Flavihumibacter sp. CACIAM 22H1]|uniref:sigma-54-dependent transcriptional regulator n=1 Tax=Flavihumibacter sp. CACIAM 22H1 TaxID=1812911 RepID=UPI0007A8B30F|nr:sigma-54 dependent transcriptional regulator [Flavihumibacter sp. CACIAM 22H1]KYP15233.1 MAG: sigma-54-dependent Fis family transcriptional regulator [Flavihumibacter sp. CACIAM 22H1]
MQKILVIDDDRDMCLLLNRFLTKRGYAVVEHYNGKKALEYISAEKPDLILCDFRLEDMDGKQVLIKTREMYPAVPFIIITGYSDVKMAVEILKLGAYDYVTKPVFPDEILVTIQKALSSEAADQPAVSSAPAAQAVRKTKAGAGEEKYIFGKTPEMLNIIKQIELVAPTNYSVIIYGESGSGKEAIAQKIHMQSSRKQQPFIAIDCGALSRELAGSELFGHEKGSFTGALNQKIGSLELANGGTIFLDEIANLPYDIQVALLRVVQERKIRRVGGNKDIELDLRIIVASNEKLWDAARNGKFREDLYHRFNEFSINVPPLRERKEDILLYARHFLAITNQELGKNIADFSAEVQQVFNSYPWYGNLRELKNVVKRSALLTDGLQVGLQALPFEIIYHNKLNSETAATPLSGGTIPVANPLPATMEKPAAPVVPSFNENSLKAVSIDAEYEMIVEALKQSNFNKTKAAKLLNIDRKTLYNKMKQYQQFNNL